MLATPMFAFLRSPVLLTCLFYLAACQADRPVVAIVGGGPAGVGAAIEAAGGAHVILLEGQAQVGGLCAYGSGITALPGEAALERWDETSGGSNAARTRYVRDIQAEFVDWFSERGVAWRDAEHADDVAVRLVAPERGGMTLVGVMAAELEQLDVDLRLNTRVTAIQSNQRFSLRTGDGATVQADAVVIATGSAVGNPARVRELLALGDGPLLRGAPDHIDGHGTAMALGLGAAEREPAQILLYAHGVPDKKDSGRSYMLLEAPGMVVVDAEGSLLRDVLKPRGNTGRALVDGPKGHGWVIFAQESRQQVVMLDSDLGRPRPLREIEANLDLRTAREVSTLEQRLAMDPGALAALDLPSRVKPPPPRGRPPPRNEAPRGYLALAVHPTTAKALTGLETDLAGHLLSATGQPIPGLYAAGEIMGFAHAFDLETLLDSSMVGGAFLTGRVAGRTALRDLEDAAD